MSKPVEKWIEKYEKRATIAAPDYEWGVKNPRASPTERAIEMKSTLVAKMADPATWDKWEKKRREAGDVKWLDGCLKKGVKHYPDGIRAGLPYYRKFADDFKKHIDPKLVEIRRMPKITIEDSVKRAEEFIRHAHAYGKS